VGRNAKYAEGEDPLQLVISFRNEDDRNDFVALQKLVIMKKQPGLGAVGGRERKG